MAKKTVKGSKATKRKPTKKATKKKTKKKVTKKKPVKGKKKEELDEITEEKLIKEIAHLLHIGIPESKIMEVFEESNVPKSEARKLIHEAKTVYTPMLIKENSTCNSTPCITIITVLILIAIAIIAVLGYLAR